MTGIERLRTLADAWGVWAHSERPAEMAGEIERERACDADAIENVRLIVGGVVDEMERHVSGVEGADDSPVARWARELRDALKSDTSDSAVQQNPSWHDPADAADVTSEAPKVTRDPADDVSMSAYDLLPKEEREAIAWVREHGGLEKIIQQRRGSVPRASFERKLGKRLRHIAECEEALRRRNATISALEKAADSLRKQIAEMLPRLMPEGMEWLVESWPRFEVRSVVFRDGGILLSDCTSVPGWGTWRSYKEPIKRPSKVLDADGVEIYKGRIAYGTRGRKYRVTELCEYEPSIVHAQAIDDGELGDEFIAANTGLNSYQLDASKLTHERPDSWERLEEDAEKDPCDYFGFDGEEICGRCPASGKNCEQTMALDIVRRAKALAERDA